MHEALAELTAKRDALNSVIAALAGVIGPAVQTPVMLPPPAGARPPRPRRPAGTKPARRTPVKASKASRVSNNTSQSAALVQLRGDAILAALKRNDGIAKHSLLRAAMPKEPGLNDEQRDDAYRNTMTRLKTKGLIDRTGDTWSLVGLGSERA